MTRAELADLIRKKETYLCIGLDTETEKLPAHLRSHPEAQFEFNKQIIDATLDHCVAYKINTAFYESQGVKGWEALQKTIGFIPSSHFTIADAKRGDIGNTASQYAKAFFETLHFDSVTVAPYMGADSVLPFLSHAGKWAIVLGLTSNKGAEDFELLKTESGFLYEEVFRKTASWGSPDNLMFVVGATQPALLGAIRKKFPEHFFLVPGIGAQGGDLELLSAAGLNNDGGLLVNASRAIIFASGKNDFAHAARQTAQQYHSDMQRFLALSKG
jgi:orotidine-5'-phosphate decarboxylase